MEVSWSRGRQDWGQGLTGLWGGLVNWGGLVGLGANRSVGGVGTSIRVVSLLWGVGGWPELGGRKRAAP